MGLNRRNAPSQARPETSNLAPVAAGTQNLGNQDNLARIGALPGVTEEPSLLDEAPEVDTGRDTSDGGAPDPAPGGAPSAPPSAPPAAPPDAAAPHESSGGPVAREVEPMGSPVAQRVYGATPAEEGNVDFRRQRITVPDEEEPAVRVLPPPREVGDVQRLPAPIEVGPRPDDVQVLPPPRQVGDVEILPPPIAVGGPEEAAPVEREVPTGDPVILDQAGHAHYDGHVDVDRHGAVGAEIHRDSPLDAEGHGHRVQAGAEVDVSERRAEASVGWERRERGADGSTESPVTVEATGHVQLDEEGHVEEAGGEVEVGVGEHISVSAGGDLEVHADEPEHDEALGRWFVSFRGELGGEAKVELEGSGVLEHLGGISVGGTASYEWSGRRAFPTREAADAFRESAATSVWEELQTGSERPLEVGEERGSETSLGATGGATGSLAGVTVGATVRFGDERGHEVQRTGEHLWRLTLTEASEVGGGATLGAVGVSLGADASHRGEERVVYELDDTLPEAAALLARFTEEGELGDPVPQKPWLRLIRRESVDIDRAGWGVGLGPMDLGAQSGTRRQDVDEDGDGVADETVFTGDTRVSGSGLGAWSGARDSIEASSEGGGQAMTQIQSSSGTDSRAMLARATGSGDGSVDGDEAESSGHWTVTSRWTPEQTRRFQTRLLAQPEREALLMGQYGFDTPVAPRLRGIPEDEAGDEARAEILADIAADYGAGGLQFVNDILGEAPRQAVTLDTEGGRDSNFLGLGERDALDRQVAQWTAALAAEDSEPGDPAAGAASLQGAILAARDAARVRISALRDLGRYTDLPDEVRVRTLEQDERLVHTLEGLLATASLSAGAAADPHGELSELRDSVIEGENDFAALLSSYESAKHTADHSRWVQIRGFGAPPGQTARGAFPEDARVHAHLERDYQMAANGVANWARAHDAAVGLRAGISAEMSIDEQRALYTRLHAMYEDLNHRMRTGIVPGFILMDVAYQQLRASHEATHRPLYAGYSLPAPPGPIPGPRMPETPEPSHEAAPEPSHVSLGSRS